jgi:U3 small nucleolar RNA-associated protein 5
METQHLKSFSPDRKLFATIIDDGKLKVWDVEKHNLKQEYVPNLHLTTPCTAFKWIQLGSGQKVRGLNLFLFRMVLMIG